MGETKQTLESIVVVGLRAITGGLAAEDVWWAVETTLAGRDGRPLLLCPKSAEKCRYYPTKSVISGLHKVTPWR